MSFQNLSAFQEVIFQATARYLTVRPEGLEVAQGQRPLRAIEARILGHGGARTLYRGRRPVCRSLDGVAKVSCPDQTCLSCEDRKHCTPQVRIDLLFEGRPCRLLLAYTSAKNFLEYAATARSRGNTLPDLRTRISVTHRGSWGELRFFGLPGDGPPSLVTPPPAVQP